MKKLILAVILLAISLIASGCLTESGEQIITVQKKVEDQNSYEDFNTVTEKSQVQKAIAIIENANFENSKIEMARYADYQFQFQSKNNREGKIATYLLWVSSTGENIEIVTESENNNYVTLPKKDSEDLYEILTGEELTN
ncbi:hypothetical protein QWY14_03055 [Planococcus sp. N028]|uniref:YhfM-like domain-containing protein n=1 Tax=Planococcus shixiaomingii TaxID=3058393 RepID=A0ABT8MYP0_9BACL|nr:hypothetical protein [Planococcus sp. N028]MDN7240748.1 hypothetical protein [Planococcus sp. N028]